MTGGRNGHRKANVFLRFVGLVAERDEPVARLAYDADRIRDAERLVGLEREVSDIVGLRPDEEAGDAVITTLEAEQLTGQVYRPSVGLLLEPGAAAELLEEALEGLIPLGGFVAQYLRGAVGQPRRQPFVLEDRIFLINRSVCAERLKFTGVGRIVAILVAFGVPHDPRTTHPLTERPLLRSCRIGL